MAAVGEKRQPPPEPPLRVLLVVEEAERAALITAALGRARQARFVVEHLAPRAGEPLEGAGGPYDALVVAARDDVAAALAPLAASQDAPLFLLVPDDVTLPDTPGIDDWMPLSQALVGDVLARAVIALRERRRREALAQTEKLRALGQMASGVAHDLNQYLGLVAGHSELALRALGDPTPDLAAAADDLRIVIKAAMDGAATVRRLQTFARPTQTRPAEPFELGTLLRDVARLTAPQWRDAAQAQGRPIVVVCDVEDAITIEGWPDSLGEALTNLVFNAIDALPNGGTIHLAARRSGSQAVVEVADSGIGMGADVQAHLFEPYFTTKGERGTGLGLSLVYGIVERHGGEIAVDSAPGRGTIFRLLLPLAQAEPAPAAEPPAQRAPAPAARASPRRILAVDDDAGLLRLVVEMLRVDGHQVTAAASGAEALERLAAEPFDLMITDLGMPGLSGWELADTVRNRYPDLPVVLATGWGAAIDQEEAEAHGVRAVLAKPYRLADLQRVVATCATLPANSLSNDHPE